MNATSRNAKIEFGDFQTPPRLARQVCELLVRTGNTPSTVIEPSCGRGAFLTAAAEVFPATTTCCGFEVNPEYVEQARQASARYSNVAIAVGDFFSIDWDSKLSGVADPVLVLGNPPWVTNAGIGQLDGTNLPTKSNVDGLRGIDALTGKANFDISEWMIRENLRWLNGRTGAVALLCKTSVARKALVHAWSEQLPIHSAAIYRIDSSREFEVSVDACLLIVNLKPGTRTTACGVFDTLNSTIPSARFGMTGTQLVSDLDSYDSLASLRSDGLTGWRSGVKHDCSRVFELTIQDGILRNGLGDAVSLEPDVLFPLLKSSDVANERPPRKFLLVPHRSMQESSDRLETIAPAAWAYLHSHTSIIQARRSSIYKNRPPFSIFGIGQYSFAPWKVGISGLYKKLHFSVIGPIDGRPVLLDDTCYSFPCETEHEARCLHALLTSQLATEFWSSLVFWDSKRPITAKLLNLLDLGELARQLDDHSPVAMRLAERQRMGYSIACHQLSLF